MTSVSEFRRAAAARLAEAGCDAPALDADLLVASVLGLRREQVIASPERELSIDEQARFLQMLRRRLSREPLAYILGEKEFYGRKFATSSAVLIPRPETELLVERGLERVKHLTEKDDLLVLDVGTGSGAIAITMLLEIAERYRFRSVRAIGSDISGSALDIARRNAALHNVEDAVELLHADLLDGVPIHDGTFALVLANLPYVPESEILPAEVARYEPPSALFGGATGLEVISRLVEQVGERKPCGRGALLLEIGCGQDLELQSRLSRLGLQAELYPDLQGISRVAEIIYQESRC